VQRQGRVTYAMIQSSDNPRQRLCKSPCPRVAVTTHLVAQIGEADFRLHRRPVKQLGDRTLSVQSDPVKRKATVEIKVLGSGCANCEALEARTLAALVIDVKVVLVGRVPSVDELCNLLTGIGS
jgi:hypothetical protein